VSRIYWDTMIFIYWLEDHPQYAKRVHTIHSRMQQRHDQLLTGAFTFGEVLTGVYRKGAADRAQEARRHLQRIVAEVVPFTMDTADRYAHLALGSVTGDLYFMAAYYAIRAPRIKGTETRGPIRLHKALAWIHGPGMILTPILGAMAFDQKSKGEKVHGIASAHGPVAIVTAAAYGAAILSVSLKF